MKIHPILFSTPMVQAIRSGRKNQTRRIIKLPKEYKPDGLIYGNGNIGIKYEIEDGTIWRLTPKYEPDDILWVRETWCNINKPEYQPEYYYKADTQGAEDYNPKEWKWCPSLFMPKAACRIFLKVNSIHAELLHDITEREAREEGVETTKSGMWKNYNKTKEPHWIDDLSCATSSFESLWRKINGNDSWAANPWIWVVKFQRCERPDNFIIFADKNER